MQPACGTVSEDVGADARDQQVGHGEEYRGDAPLQVGSAADRIEQPIGRHLAAQDLEAELLELNRWVDWLRHTYGLPASVTPPCWHRHPELVWELSSLHLHWLCAYDLGQNGSAPLGCHRDFTDARHRLRDWVTASGTRLDRDRPTRQTTWPGEEPQPAQDDSVITDRDADFVQYVIDQVNKRQTAEDANNARGERPQKYDHYLKGTLYCACGAKLMIERLKLVQAHYADAIPLDLLKASKTASAPASTRSPDGSTTSPTPTPTPERAWTSSPNSSSTSTTSTTSAN